MARFAASICTGVVSGLLYTSHEPRQHPQVFRTEVEILRTGHEGRVAGIGKEQATLSVPIVACLRLGSGVSPMSGFLSSS